MYFVMSYDLNLKNAPTDRDKKLAQQTIEELKKYLSAIKATRVLSTFYIVPCLSKEDYSQKAGKILKMVRIAAQKKFLDIVVSYYIEQQARYGFLEGKEIK